MDNDPPTNYLGALIFWSYILLALLTTLLILKTILSLHQPHPRNHKPATVYFSLFAVLSFVTLSYTMLNVLIQSYTSWSDLHSIPYPTNLRALVGAERIPLHLWHWSTHSSLFQDFAAAIVQRPARRVWTVASLQTTLMTSVFIGIEGLSCPALSLFLSLNTFIYIIVCERLMNNLGRRLQIPNLWAFFLLLEILPTSFTQTLFYVAWLRSSSEGKEGTADVAARPARRSRWVGFGVAWLVCMGLVGSAAGSAYLMGVVLLTRVLLVLPLFGRLLPVEVVVLGPERLNREEDGGVWLVWGMLGLQTVGIVVDGVSKALKEGSWVEVLEAVGEHPAVSALGYDAVLSLVAACSWILVRRRIPIEAKMENRSK